MAQVTGFTATRMQAIEDDTITTGSVDGSGDLILFKRDGTSVNAGAVRGADGDPLSVLQAWPVGSIFMSVVATNPNTLLGGGTWSPWGVGRVPVGVDTSQTEFDTVEKLGGAKTHALSTSEMPSHNHSVTGGSHTHEKRWRENANSFGPQDNVAAAGGTGGSLVIKSIAWSSGSDHTHSVGTAGSGSAHNNLQPYITCYMWVRTA